MLTLRQMRYFEALASVLHFGRAAELVHVSQPALSSQIREMEAYLGVTLVERNRGNILLTRKGEEVLEHVRGVLAGVERLEQAVRRGGGLLDGPVRLGIIPTVAPYLVPKLVPHLRSAYPAIEVELKEAVTDRLITDLAEGRWMWWWQPCRSIKKASPPGRCFATASSWPPQRMTVTC